MDRFLLLVLAAALLASAGCSSPPDEGYAMRMPPQEPEPEAPRPVEAQADLAAAAIAPRPFTAEQIREAMPVGFSVRSQLEVAGRPPMVQVMRVVGSTPEQATMQVHMESPEGELVGDVATQTETWTGLRDHATFTAADTLRTDVLVEVPAGRFEAWLYSVVTADVSRTVVSRFHFAKELPGPPVRYERLEDGQTTYLLTLLAYGVEGEES